ncbi:MAG: glycosyltransferase family 8 protein [Porphyromonadaceae bacterium]|nr:glycosyltransferase family 8 protein [Porphyromonadaceae bacterium]
MQSIPIIVAFTPNYLLPASVTLSSILSASRPDACYEVICLLSESLSDDDVRRLEAIDQGLGRLSFRFLEFEDRLSGVYVDPKYTAAANYRLVVADLLPEYDRAIYLDCDIIVRQDLALLYETLDLGGNYLAGIAEASTQWQISRMPQGCDPGQYINSGFLVMNLDLFRRDRVGDKLIEVLRVPYLEFPDQDALNIVCKGRIHYLPPRYNGIRTFVLPAYKEDFLRYYTEQDWEEISMAGTIHYTGEKPWRAYTLFFELWWQQYWKLPNLVKEGMEVDRRLERLARLFSLPLVRPIANVLLGLKRRLRR